MKSVYITIFILIKSLSLDAQLSSIKWVNSGQGEKNDWVWDMKTDEQGNVYYVGHFHSDTLRVNGTLLYNKIKQVNPPAVTIYLIKYSPSGQLIWAKNFHSDGYLASPHIDISKSNHIILTYFTGQSTLIKYDTYQIHIPKEYYRGIVVNYLDENANLLWHKVLIDSILTYSDGRVLFDKNEDIVLGGVSGSGTMTDEKGNVLIRDSVRTYKCFLLKIDKEGRVIWTKSFGNESTTYISAIASDEKNNIIIYGWFGGAQLRIDEFAVINRSKEHLGILLADAYVAKLDHMGKAQWLNSIYGTADDRFYDVKIITDQNGSIYQIGIIQSDTLHFDNKIRLFRSKFRTQSGPVDLFYAKYDSDGKVMWAKKIDNGVAGGLDNITLSLSPDQRLFLAGTYDSIGFRSGEIVLPSYGLNDIFLFECNTEGDIISKGSFGSIGFEYITDIDFDKESNLYLAGSYSSKELKIGDVILINDNPDLAPNLYIFKLCPEPVSAVSKTEKIINVVYLSDLHSIRIQGLEGTEKGVCSLYDISGIVILKKELIMDPDTVIPLPELAGGVYIAEIRTARGQYCTKIIRR